MPEPEIGSGFLILDEKNREWLCFEVEPKTISDQLKRAFSPRAYVGLQITKASPLYESFDIIPPSIHLKWSEAEEDFFSNIVEKKANNSEALKKSLSKVDYTIVDETTVQSLFDFGEEADEPSGFSPSPDADKLRTAILEICRESLEFGNQKYSCGEYRMNNHNYAKDIINAANYVEQVINCIEDHQMSVMLVVLVLEDQISEFERQYEDMEGFGVGTIREIINKVKVLN